MSTDTPTELPTQTTWFGYTPQQIQDRLRNELCDTVFEYLDEDQGAELFADTLVSVLQDEYDLALKRCNKLKYLLDRIKTETTDG